MNKDQDDCSINANMNSESETTKRPPSVNPGSLNNANLTAADHDEITVDVICDAVDDACEQLSNHNDEKAVEILSRLHYLLLDRLSELSPITDDDRDLYDCSLKLYNTVVSTLRKANSWQNVKHPKIVKPS